MASPQQKVADLIARGYSLPAIACRLNVSLRTVRNYLALAGIRSAVAPAGYYGIPDAAERCGCHLRTLRLAVVNGELPHVRCGGRYYISMEAVHHWLENEPEREAARAMAVRVFQAKGPD